MQCFMSPHRICTIAWPFTIDQVCIVTTFPQVGDAVAEADPAPSEAQNYFAMLRETPSTLLPRLVAQWGCSDSTAERVASLLGSDLVSIQLRLCSNALEISL